MVKIIIFIFILLLISTVIAEAPKYNFASIQKEKEITASPGDTINGKVYFFNVHGNRNTHVKVKVLEKPENWEVKITPETKKETYDVSGMIIEVEENFVIPPSNFSERPIDVEGLTAVKTPDGYVNANELTIMTTIPENSKIGSTEKIKIYAEAFWLGQGGSLDLKQEREFEFNIKVLSEEYYEKNIPDEQEKSSSLITGAVIGGGTTGKIIFAFVGIIIILLIIAIKKRK